MSDINDVLPEPKTCVPGLYIVATPIGNLRDMTLRAIDTLRAADMILAEDTRHTRKLLNAFDIRANLTAYHDHNAAKQIPVIIDALDAGKIVAQVSDAGTPLVSDPGFRVVNAAIEAGHKIIPVPGASAPLAALTTAGLPSDKFTFLGFPPPKTKARQTALKSYINIPTTLIFFESANRVLDTLMDMNAVFGDRPAVLARELTKTYEDIRRGTLNTLISGVVDDPPRGEIVVMVGPPLKEDNWREAKVDAALRDWVAEIGVKRASAHVADMSGWPKRDVYQRAIALGL